jgi:hypothetical protein
VEDEGKNIKQKQLLEKGYDGCMVAWPGGTLLNPFSTIT